MIESLEGLDTPTIERLVELARKSELIPKRLKRNQRAWIRVVTESKPFEAAVYDLYIPTRDDSTLYAQTWAESRRLRAAIFEAAGIPDPAAEVAK